MPTHNPIFKLLTKVYTYKYLFSLFWKILFHSISTTYETFSLFTPKSGLTTTYFITRKGKEPLRSFGDWPPHNGSDAKVVSGFLVPRYWVLLFSRVLVIIFFEGRLYIYNNSQATLTQPPPPSTVRLFLECLVIHSRSIEIFYTSSTTLHSIQALKIIDLVNTIPASWPSACT